MAAKGRRQKEIVPKSQAETKEESAFPRKRLEVGTEGAKVKSAVSKRQLVNSIVFILTRLLLRSRRI
jgi:hypothetical protein